MKILAKTIVALLFFVSFFAFSRGFLDRTPPSIPSELSNVNNTSSILLSWTPSTDKSGIYGYEIYRDNVRLTFTSSTSYEDNSVENGNTYEYKIRAIDRFRNKSGFSSVLSILFGEIIPPPPGGDGDGVVDPPKGIFSIDKIIDKPYIDGVLLRIYWEQIEKIEGTYDFTSLVSKIKSAQALGQKVSIASMVIATPSWLLAKCESFVNPGQISHSVCVPWDESMLASLQKYISALANTQIDGIRLADHPAVANVDAAIGGIQSVRLTSLPSGYSQQLFIDSVHRSVSLWREAFPNKNIYVGLFGVSDNANPSTASIIRDDLLSSFNVSFFQEVLSGSAPGTTSPLGKLLYEVKDSTAIMFQACGEWSAQSAWSWCHFLQNDDPSKGFAEADLFNADYTEIYEKDLLNASYEAMFTTRHDTIWSSP